MADHKNHSHLIFKVSIISLFLSLHFFGHINSVQSSPQDHSYHEIRQGRWELLLENVGVVAMHMALTHYDTVVIFEQAKAGPSRYRLRRRYGSRRRCSFSNDDDKSDSDCYAHSVEYNIKSNQIRPLRMHTDPWCSSGSFLSNGTLLQAGGNRDGARRIRYFTPCANRNCDWRESRRARLSDERWYASSVALPEKDLVTFVGGRRAFSYEFVPKRNSEEDALHLPLLSSTYDRNSQGNNLYPFVHLSSDGNLFIFANRDSILFDYRRNEVVRTFPRIPGGGSRNYPSSGSSVILPLDHRNNFQQVEVMICGGAASGAYQSARQNHRFLEGLRSCGRMVIAGRTSSSEPRWHMEDMPSPRLMNDMIILPTGDVLIINGAERGAAGWERATNASLRPFLYKPNKVRGRRFSVLGATSIPRMYHSSAVLLPDGRVLVGGSNPHSRYRSGRNVEYPTELRLEAFVPYYMEQQYQGYRPSNITIHYAESHGFGASYGEDFRVRFWLGRRPSDDLHFTVYPPPFTTHSMSMNQRLLRLRARSVERRRDGWAMAVLEAPPSPSVAPSGYYLLTIVNGGVPSESQWLRFVHPAN